MKKGLLLILLILLFIPHPVLAADISSDVASSYQITDTNVVAGDIVSSGANGLVRSSTEYDMKIFGVYTETAAVIIRSADTTYKPIVRSGPAIVNVTSANGAIKKGDYITTSKNAGKGEKAALSGYVLGTAMEDLSGNSGTIQVAVQPEYAEISNAQGLARLFNYFTVGLFSSLQDQGQFPMVLRYIMAGLVMMLSIIISFITFSRSVPKAIEAIGRNPLARSAIMLSLAMSIGLVIITIGLGLAAAIVILRI